MEVEDFFKLKQYSLSKEEKQELLFDQLLLLHKHHLKSSPEYKQITESLFKNEIKNISAGNYILQAAFISYRTFFKNVELPLQGGSVLGAIIMKPIALNLKEAEVSSERIPLLFKKDTTEYDAAAFKTLSRCHSM